jgi:hypothetical protein
LQVLDDCHRAETAYGKVRRSIHVDDLKLRHASGLNESRDREARPKSDKQADNSHRQSSARIAQDD